MFFQIYTLLALCMTSPDPGPVMRGGSHGISLHWRHNERGGVSNHQPYDCLLSCSFRRRTKKTSKLRVTGLCVRIHRGPVNSPHKRPVTRGKCFHLRTSSCCVHYVQWVKQPWKLWTRSSIFIRYGESFKVCFMRIINGGNLNPRRFILR